MTTKEKSQEYLKQWRKEHKDQLNQYAINYYHEHVKNNPEAKAKRAAYHAKWQKENKDKFNAYHREYRRRKRSEANEKSS